MKKIRNCKHCYELFQSRRSNHVYCTTSCKTKASYKRNDYKYVSGHYQKANNKLEENTQGITSDFIRKQMEELENKVDSLVDNQNKSKSMSFSDLKSTAIGSVAADAAVYAAKKMLMPNSLPATKGDVLSLKQELQNLRFLLAKRNA